MGPAACIEQQLAVGQIIDDSIAEIVRAGADEESGSAQRSGRTGGGEDRLRHLNDVATVGEVGDCRDIARDESLIEDERVDAFITDRTSRPPPLFRVSLPAPPL